MCQNFGTPKNNKFSICSPKKLIYHLEQMENLVFLGVQILKHIMVAQKKFLLQKHSKVLDHTITCSQLLISQKLISQKLISQSILSKNIQVVWICFLFHFAFLFSPPLISNYSYLKVNFLGSENLLWDISSLWLTSHFETLRVDCNSIHTKVQQ